MQARNGQTDKAFYRFARNFKKRTLQEGTSRVAVDSI